MPEPNRYQYTIDLNDWVDVDPHGIVQFRAPSREDAGELALLMLDAYRNTIDYDGETIVEAREEIEGFFTNDPDLVNSRVAMISNHIVSACLVTAWKGHPFVSYVMTGVEYKGKGIGTATLRASLRSFEQAGHISVGAFITEANLPSEAMFYRVGAVQQPTHVLHIAEKKDWEACSDTYTPASFAEDGFIHCSTPAQLDGVASAFYAGRDDLTLLTIAAVRVGSMLVYEDLYEANALFPHIYQPLPLDAVVEAVRYSVP
ncbi:MAG: GNAT family N-acetyltransferase [Acidimicrobiia bacterium]|jgi:uncharacterized protein (DUF952 family)